MRRVWAAVLSVWATIAIVGTLAWSHAPAQPVAQGKAVPVLVRGQNGTLKKAQAVLLPAGAASHVTTGTSMVAAKP